MLVQTRHRTRSVAGAGCAAALALASLVAPCAQATTASLRDAEAAYVAGLFDRAVATAEKETSAAPGPAHLLLAKTLCAQAVLNPERSAARAQSVRAEHHARAALAQAPNSAEARRYLAAAIWLAHRDEPALRAWRAGAPQEAHKLLTDALTADPADAWAHALLGGWNLEIVRRGGATGARLLGASRRTGRSHCARAVELDPGDAAIAVQCAIALLSVAPQRYREEALHALALADQAAPNDAFEAAMQERGRLLAQLIITEQSQEAASIVAVWLDGETPS